MATDSLGVDQVQKENQALKNQVSELISELKNLKEEVKSCQKKLKKVEYEKDNAEGHVINLKRDLDALRKELYDERRKWKQEKEELSKACQRERYSAESEQQLSNSLNSHLNSSENDSKDIKAVLEEAATQAMSKSGFVYDERTGLYYDWNCGLYYDPNSCLYYNNQTGTYYFYDETSKSYKFHSQVEVLPEENTNEQNNDKQDKPPKKKKKSKPTKKRKVIKVKSSSDEECSSGEIISTDEDDDDDDDDSDLDDDDDDDDVIEEKVHKVAPCIRAIVTESDKLKIGTLFIITFTGGTLGREKEVGHGIRIPDVSISKYHCRISYDQERRQYFITDLGSKNGSFLNEERLGQGIEESDPHVLTHRDVLKVGGTSLAIHIHQGNETCDDCEPGLVQAKLSAVVNSDEVCESNTNSQGNLSSEDKRKKLLRNLKKAYGLEKEAYEEDIDVPNKRKYRDRADLRRIKVGSDVPVELPDAPPASVHRPINSENKGRKMLEKMGWKAGEGLGKEGSGLKEPVTAGIHEKLRGLGSGSLRSIDSANFSPTISSVMRSKARERYQKTQTSDTQIVTIKETVFVPQTTKP